MPGIRLGFVSHCCAQRAYAHRRLFKRAPCLTQNCGEGNYHAGIISVLAKVYSSRGITTLYSETDIR